MVLMTLSGIALAEGSDQLSGQRLDAETTLYVDILDHMTETIEWRGNGEVSITSPSGKVVGEIGDGQSFDPDENGTWRLDPQRGQSFDWDVRVDNAVGGRLHSLRWQLNGDGYEEEDGFSTSLYALVPAGDDGYDVVLEVELDGLTGYDHHLLMDGQGTNGRSESCPTPNCDTVEVEDPYPVYLTPPEKAAYVAIQPQISDLTLTIEAEDESECGVLAPGISEATFTFSSNVSGSYALICDLNGDGAFDRTSDDDVLITGLADRGENRVTWDGTDNSGDVVPSGTYDCRVELTVGEMHFLALDIETIYQGMRFYSVDGKGDRTAVAMYWNDDAIQGDALQMPNGEKGSAGPGENGMDPGPYINDVEANANARAWGAFNEQGKGNTNLLDTYGFIEMDRGTELTVVTDDGTADSDGDGLTDAEEDCEVGTDPYDPDTDGGGQPDGYEVENGQDPLDASDDVVDTGAPAVVGTYKGGTCAASTTGRTKLGWLFLPALLLPLLRRR